MPWFAKGPLRRIRRRNQLAASRTHDARVEWLEVRAYLHGDEDHESHYVADDPTAPNLVLQHDTVPNFVRNPTHVSVGSGDWNSPSTWSTGSVPGANAVVQIRAGNTVTVSTVNNTSLAAVGVNPGGMLRFATNVNTRLTVGTMIVFQGGHLQIGSVAAPVAANVQAELVIANRPLDLVNDPRQYGTGLIVAGKVEMHGTPIAKTFVRLLRELRAGQTFLEIYPIAPPDWQVGDTLIIPDTRQVPGALVTEHEAGNPVFAPQWEEVTIAGFSGNRVLLTAPLQYDHLGPRDADGVPSGVPHVAVLDRNVIVRSENPSGTRGHTLYGLRAEVDIRYARFKDLGRTTAFLPLNNTTFDAHGNLTHVGTNQIGRYSVHIHHVLGPVNSSNRGYQFRFIGNTVDNGKKWGVAIHGSSYGLLTGNVIYNVEGAGIATEDGSELYNEITRNFIMRTVGNNESPELGTDAHINDTGRGGVGIWLRRSGNIVRENIVVNSTNAGISISGKLLNQVTVGKFRGADPMNPDESEVLMSNPPGQLFGNEVYGRTGTGVWISWPQNYRLTVDTDILEVSGQSVWNVHVDGILVEFADHVVITGARLLADRTAISSAARGSSVGINAGAHSLNETIIENSRIEGFKYGIRTPPDDKGTETTPGTLIRDTSLQNYINVAVATTKGDGKHLELRNLTFETLNVPAANDVTPNHIYLIYTPNSGQLLSMDIIRVVDMNGDPGADFRLYYPQQVANFVVPPSSSGVGGAPVSGMTNWQLWQNFGLAIGGAVAPMNTPVSLAGTNAIAHRLEVRGQISGPAQAVRGASMVYTLTAQDRSVHNQPSQFIWLIDWDSNGTVDKMVTGPSGMQIGHTYDGNGTRTARVTAMNLLGETGAAASMSVGLIGYRLVVNPSDPDSMMLEWYGTPGADQVSFSVSGSLLMMTEHVIDGVSSGQTWVFDASSISVIAATGLAGHDHIDATNVGLRNVLLVGNEGNDSLFGGASNDYIDGGDGDDVLAGGDEGDYINGGNGADILAGQGGDDLLLAGSGRDMLLGGDGADNLSGANDDDLLIAGLMAFADFSATLNTGALQAIASEWRSSRSYADRVANISGVGLGPRNNGTNFLMPGVSVFFDNDRDTLAGGNQNDWYLYSSTAPIFEGLPIPTDSLSGLESGETRTNTPHLPPGW